MKKYQTIKIQNKEWLVAQDILVSFFYLFIFRVLEPWNIAQAMLPFIISNTCMTTSSWILMHLCFYAFLKLKLPSILIWPYQFHIFMFLRELFRILAHTQIPQKVSFTTLKYNSNAKIKSFKLSILGKNILCVKSLPNLTRIDQLLDLY